MADISKCSGENCPLRDTCTRYTAPASYWQAYIPPAHLLGGCPNYWPETKKPTLEDSTP